MGVITSHKTVLCPYCFRKFKVHDLLFRCESETDTRCQQADHAYAETFGINPTPQPRVFMYPPPIKRNIITNSRKYFQAECPTCHIPTNKRVCPHCHTEIVPGMLDIPGEIIAIIGASNSGKSNYIGILINELKKLLAKHYDASLSEIDKDTESLYLSRYYKILYSKPGQVISRTKGKAVDHDLRKPLLYKYAPNNSRLSQMCQIAFFDTAGEDMDDPKFIRLYIRYIHYASAIIFVLDPLHFIQVQEELRDDYRGFLTDLSEDLSPFYTVNRIINQFRAGYADISNPVPGIPEGQKIDVPVAFTFSKIDLIENLIEQNSPILYDSIHHGRFNLTDFEAVDAEMRHNITKWDVPLMQLITQNFSNYAFFAVSSFGQPPDPKLDVHHGISPRRVCDPVLWILSEFGRVQTTR